MENQIIRSNLSQLNPFSEILLWINSHQAYLVVLHQLFNRTLYHLLIIPLPLNPNLACLVEEKRNLYRKEWDQQRPLNPH